MSAQLDQLLDPARLAQCRAADAANAAAIPKPRTNNRQIVADGYVIERSKGMDYFEVDAEYFGSVIVGCYYSPAIPDRITSAYTLSRTGDPGHPGCSAECEVIEVWDHGREIGQSLTDSAVACMCAAVLAGRGMAL